MIFRTYCQLASDIREWCRRLPQFDAVCGIPRSGTIPATMIAMERNVHLVSIDDVLRGERPWESPLRRGCRAKTSGQVLLVDDTVATGKTIEELRASLPDPKTCTFAAVYAMDSGVHAVDYWCKCVGANHHMFEWNILHHGLNERVLVDLDGVICRDWNRQNDEGESLMEYIHHLENVAPLRLPTFPVMEIVTARLERYRPQTEAWLKRHGVPYRSLNMAPYGSSTERAAAGGFAERKARIYSERSDAILFIESSRQQATVIAEMTGRPVLAFETLELFNGADFKIDQQSLGESEKARQRRQSEGWFPRFAPPDRPGIDIGGGRDPLHKEFRVWDVVAGDSDATEMAGIADGEYHTVYSSHLLEHLACPVTALRNWFRILKPGGHLIVVVPHRNLYERKSELPSKWNLEHKAFYLPEAAEQPDTRSLKATILEAIPDAHIVHVRTLSDGWHPVGEDDHAIGEYSIEAIVRK